jgi:hypothetical protein
LRSIIGKRLSKNKNKILSYFYISSGSIWLSIHLDFYSFFIFLISISIISKIDEEGYVAKLSKDAARQPEVNSTYEIRIAAEVSHGKVALSTASIGNFEE